MNELIYLSPKEKVHKGGSNPRGVLTADMCPDYKNQFYKNVDVGVGG